MKNYLLTYLFTLLLYGANAQNMIYQDDALNHRLNTYHLKAGETYTKTYLNDHLGNTIQIRARQRFSFTQIAKSSLPFLAGAAYGIFGGRSKSFGQETLLSATNKLPSIVGGAAISGASFLFRSAKKASVNLIYRNAIGQVIHSESRVINTGKKNDIGLWRLPFESVDVSVTAPAGQGVNVTQAKVSSGGSSDPTGPHTNSECWDCPVYPDYGDGSYGSPYVGSFLDSMYGSENLAYMYGGDTYYYSGSGYAGYGYYQDPTFTEPGHAGYYPMNNPGPDPVNGPGLYPASRQAEVYKYLWDHQTERNVEQAAYITDQGIFILPDHGSKFGDNTINSGQMDGFPGINIEPYINGTKKFVYKGTTYQILGAVHTHPTANRYPQGTDGASDDDLKVAKAIKGPNFVIADEGIWRIRGDESEPGTLLHYDYTLLFDDTAPISNLYNYL